MLRFDPGTHTYWLGDRRLPSVTEILRASGRWYAPRSVPAALKGRRVHLLTLQADVSGLLPPETPPAVAAAVGAYRRFRQLLAAVPERREVPQARADLGFAGTPDWEGLVAGVPTLADLKTGEPADWHRLQTAGYDLLDPSRSGRQRMSVYLGDDGRFRIRIHTSRGDYAEFLDMAREHVRREGQADGEATGDDDEDWWR